LEWQSKRSPEEIECAREKMIRALEKADSSMRKGEHMKTWFKGCHDHIKVICENTNGQLFYDLLVKAGYKDPSAAYLLRDGMYSMLSLALFSYCFMRCSICWHIAFEWYWDARGTTR